MNIKNQTSAGYCLSFKSGTVALMAVSLLWVSLAADARETPPAIYPANSNQVTLPVLEQAAQDATVSERVTELFTQSHYRQFDLDAAFSAKIFDRYLNLLDYNHNVLLASDIAPFAQKKGEIGKDLKQGQLNLFYQLFNLSQQRRLARYQYALSLLKTPLSFTGNDSINLDRSKAAWPTSNEQLDTLWQQRVKYEWLNLQLAGKKPVEIKDILQRRYQTAIHRLTQTSSEDVFQLAMTSFAREIDPHTNYLSPRNTEQFNTEMSLSMEGIGAVLQMEDDYAQIQSLVVGGPAEKSHQLKVGDRIVSVGQAGKPMVDVVGWRLDDIVAMIKGPKGTRVRLEVLAKGKATKPRQIVLVRDKIHLQDRAAKLTTKKVGSQTIGILTIPSFYVGLSKDVQKQLQLGAKAKISSLVIDLRADGGGALTEAIDLSGLFIASGPVVQVRDNTGAIRIDSDTDNKVYYSGPLVILVDRFSASASEIFTAAMQDYGRALVVGEPTYGKGTVQQYRTLSRIYDQMLRPEWPALGSVQYTIQKFYRINGGSTQRKGVTPDILMPSADQLVDTGERFEENALPWDSILPANYIKNNTLPSLIDKVNQQHEKRVSSDENFQFIRQEIARYNAKKATQDIISLNYQQRKQQADADEARQLLQINRNLKQMGKPVINNMDKLPKDYQAPDFYLDETANIAADLANDLQGKSTVPQSALTSQ